MRPKASTDVAGAGQGRAAMTARWKATMVSSSSSSASVLSAPTQDLISSAVAPARPWYAS
jgi:hypothetical protein